MTASDVGELGGKRSSWRSLAVAFAVFSSVVTPAPRAFAQAGNSGNVPTASSTAANSQLRAVFHFADGARDAVMRGLQNAQNGVHALGNEPARFVIVVHGPALRWFRRQERANVGPQLAALLDTRRVEWRVCRVTLEQNGWSESDLLPAATVVASGTLEILRLQQQGFAYFRP